ncbi:MULTISPECIES: phage tail tape measure protein [Lactobacillus]|uniref:Phage tail tape measure protein n=1 Tax=Lactobacillus xujianguonis TaxID=2495899 RepID=A0A437SSW4_9LACO|nr:MULTISPECIES: phage tail tape measure protein [Lactobacillus]RVU69932.1 phage tail tape measure protein [Lactobacillus xujianguonis]
MAEHEGWYLKANVDISGILQADKATEGLLKNLKKVETGFGTIKPNDALAKSIKSADIATASYVQRLDSEGKKYEAAQQKSKLYAEQINRLKDRQHGLVTELDRIAEKSGRTSDAYNIQKARINQTAVAINNFKSDLKKTQTEMDRLRPTGFNRLIAGAKRVTTAGEKMKTTLRDGWDHIKGGAMSAALGVGAFSAAAVSGAKKATNLQQSYREITNLAVLGGEHQKEVTKAVAKMQQEGRAISIKYGKSQQEIAVGYEDLVKRGYSTKQALGALRTEVQASVASGDDFKDVTSVSSQVIEAFGMKARTTGAMVANTRKAVNMLAYSADATSTSFHTLGDSVHYFGAAAKAQHISLAESSAAVGILSNNGIEGSMGGTAMRDIINRIGNGVNSIGKKNSVFSKIGITAKDIEDSKGHIKSLADAMGVIWTHIKQHSKNSVQEQGFMKSIFGTTAQNAATILAQNTKDLQDLTKRVQKAGDSGSYVAKLAAKNMGTAQGAMARAKQATNAFTMTIGTAMLPALNEASNELAKFLLSKDGEQFQKNVGGAVKNVADSIIGVIKWVSMHPTATEWIAKGMVAGYTGSKALQALAFLGKLKNTYSELAAQSSKINSIGKGTSQLVTPHIKWGDMSRTAKLTATASVVFDAAEIGKNFYDAVHSSKASVKATKYGQGIGGIVGAAIGASLGGYAGATIGTELGQAMGEPAAKSFAKAFSGHATKYLIPNTKKQKDKRGRIPKKLKADANGYYDAKGKYHDQRSLAERSWDMNHTMDNYMFTHPNNIADFLFGGASTAWNAIGHIGDKGYWKRSLPRMRASAKGSWLDWSGANKWTDKHIWPGLRGMFNPQKLPKGYAVKGSYSSRVAPLFTNIGKWFGKQNWDWGPFDPKQNGLDKFLAGFKPQVHGKAPKKWHIKMSGILPKVNAEKWGRGIVKDAQRGMSHFPSWTRQLGSKSSSWFKSKWTGLEAWGAKVRSNAQKGWNGFKTWFGDLGKNAVAMFKKPFEGLGSWIEKHTPKPVRQVVGKVGQGINWVKGKLTGAHATGGLIGAAHGALVGEAGPELAYTPYANHARLLGANGPQLTRVNAGERILNAKDTRKVMTGGLGHGLILNGYAAGNVSLGHATKNVTSDYKKINREATGSLRKLTRANKSSWRGITSTTTKQSSKTRKSVISNYTTMKSKVSKQMDNMHDGVVKTARSTAKGFGTAMSKMNGYAKDAMSDTIGQLNKGINGIDKVLSQFGGNGSVIKPVHFATGSGALPRNTWAMVNDAPTGPRQEAIVKKNGDIHIPRGANRQMLLEKGDAVLNGYQTQELAHSWGLTHFAKGSGVSHSQLRKIADNGLSNPAKSFANMYTSNIKSSGPAIQRGTIDLGKNSSAHYGNPWMNAMWTVINNAIGGGVGKGGTREAFLKYAEKTFSGVPYVMGAMSKAASDCSGMVSQALHHFGLDAGRTTVAMQHSPALQYLGKDLSKTLPGDLVIYGHGTGAAGHVGIIKNPQTHSMFNETPPRARVTSIDAPKSMGYGYYRVRGLYNAKPKQGQKATGALTNLAKRELGKSALKWISDNLADQIDGGFMAGKPTGDHNHWLKQAHIPEKYWSAMNYVVSHESGWNPAARNPSSGTLGLGQMQGYNLHYYRAHGSIRNAIAQLAGTYDYMNDRYGNPNKAQAWWESHHWYSRGGDHWSNKPFIAGEHGPEIVTPKSPVHIDDFETTKRKVADLGRAGRQKTPSKTATGHGQIVVNINFNGPITGDEASMRKMANIAKREVVKQFEALLNHEEGSDPTIF